MFKVICELVLSSFVFNFSICNSNIFFYFYSNQPFSRYAEEKWLFNIVCTVENGKSELAFKCIFPKIYLALHSRRKLCYLRSKIGDWRDFLNCNRESLDTGVLSAFRPRGSIKSPMRTLHLTIIVIRQQFRLLPSSFCF